MIVAKSTRARFAIAAAAAAVVSVGFSNAARAADSYWDANGAAVGASVGGIATGTWGIDPFWTTDPTGATATSAWTPGDNAIFSAGTDATGSYTVTVDSTQTASGVRFEEGDVTLAGGELDLSGTATVEVAAPTATINSVLGGTAGLTKTGAGVLTLGGANTNTGLHTVSVGTLRLGASDRIADAAPLTVSSGATFDLNGFNETIAALNGGGNITLGAGNLTASSATAASFSGAISGSGSFTKAGANTLALTGTSSYSGVTNVNAGTLAINSNASIGDGSATNTVAFNGGTLRLDAPLTFARPITMAGAGTINTNNNDSSLSSTAVLSGNGNFTKSGAGRLTLNAASPSFGPGGTTAGGRITVSAGTLVIPDNAPATVLGAAGATMQGGVENNTTINSGATIEITGTYNATDQLLISGDGVGGVGAIHKVGNNTTTIARGITLNASARIRSDAGELVLTASSAGRTTTSGPPVLTFDGAGNIRTTGTNNGGNWNFAIGTSQIVKEGTGTLTLGGISSFTGGILIKNGVVSADADTTGTGSQELGTTPAYVANALILDGGVLQYANGTTLSSNTNRGMQLTSNGGTVRVANSQIAIFQSTIGVTTTGGTGTLTKDGPGELRYNANATQTRAGTGFTKLVVNDGLFRLGNVTNANFEVGFGALPTGPLSDAITLSNNGAIGASFGVTLDTNRGITLGSTGGVINLVSAPLNVPGVISGVGPLRIIGTQGSIVSGLNSYTGGTIIGGDITQIGGISPTVGGVLSINGDAALGFVPASPTPNNVQLGTAGAAGTLTVTQNTTLNANRGINIGAGNGTISIASPIAVGYAGTLTGAGNLTKTGSGLLTLGGTNTYTGTTTSFGGGTLAISADANLGTVPAAPLATSINLAGATTGGTLSAASSVTLNANRGITLANGGADPDLGVGGTLDAATGATFTVPGIISGTGRLNKTGAGTVVLTNTNTYGGKTTVAGGTLQAATTGSLPGYNTAGKVTANAGATLAVNYGGGSDWTQTNVDDLRAAATLNAGSFLGFDTTNVPAGASYNSAIAGAYGVKKLGANALTLGSPNTYTGGTGVVAGTLVVGDADALAAGALDVSDGAIAKGQTSLPKAITVSTLATHTSGKLDLTNNSMVVRSSSLAAVQAQVASGFAAGAWTGAGIDSSNAAADPTHRTAIGYADNSVLNKGSFKNVTGLTGSDILVKYTYYGDADLNGVVTLDDFTQFLSGYQGNGSTWLVGDFDYNGKVTLDDFTLFLDAYQNQGAPLAALDEAVASANIGSADRAFMLAAIQAVPEPTSLALLGVAGAGLLSRRRRSK